MDAHHGQPDRPRGVPDGGENVDIVGADELAFFHVVDHRHEIVQDAVGQRLCIINIQAKRQNVNSRQDTHELPIAVQRFDVARAR